MLTDSPVAKLQVRIGQKIGTGNADLRRSITGGLTNAVGGAIYGNSPLKNAGQALLRGGAAGAASSGINYLSDSLDTRKIREDALRRMAQGRVPLMHGVATPAGCAVCPIRLQAAWDTLRCGDTGMKDTQPQELPEKAASTWRTSGKSC